MKEASFFTKQNGEVQCQLCPHNCIINEGKRGSCRVRINDSGKLYSENYGQVSSVNFDPIEKKPLYHFYPGRTIFSVGSVGCNLHCKFCQNWEISQTGVEKFSFLKNYSAKDIVNHALSQKDNFGIAYTYNEPTVWYEFMLDIAKLALEKGLKNVMVTNGFINQEPLEQLIPFMDAFSVDLKAFNDGFYKKHTSSKLDPVLKTLKFLSKSKKHFEITNLVITDTNDNEKEFSQMVDWIKNELGQETVFHISRYYPMYKMSKESTSPSKLISLFNIAASKLDYVFLGNIHTGKGQNTYCSKCGSEVILRSGYSTKVIGLNDSGRCSSCGNTVLAEGCY